jgi:hypothetical protein
MSISQFLSLELPQWWQVSARRGTHTLDSAN